MCCRETARIECLTVGKSGQAQKRLSTTPEFRGLPANGTVGEMADVDALGRQDRHGSDGLETKVEGYYSTVESHPGTNGPTAFSVEPIELVYQTPDRVLGKQSRAILFLAHGCSHAATDFFDQSPTCPKCIGLPVERRIVRSERGGEVWGSGAVSTLTRAKPLPFTSFHPSPLHTGAGSTEERLCRCGGVKWGQKGEPRRL
jgi:hypothetical protein